MLSARLSCSSPDRFRWRYNDPFRRHFFAHKKRGQRLSPGRSPGSPATLLLCPYPRHHAWYVVQARLSAPPRQRSPTRRPASCSSGRGSGRRPILGFRGGQLSNCCHCDRSSSGNWGNSDGPRTAMIPPLLPLRTATDCHCATPLHHGNPPP